METANLIEALHAFVNFHGERFKMNHDLIPTMRQTQRVKMAIGLLNELE